MYFSFSVSKNGEKTAPPSEITCPPGWMWDDDAWIYDINRAVDEKGETRALGYFSSDSLHMN